MSVWSRMLPAALLLVAASGCAGDGSDPRSGAEPPSKSDRPTDRPTAPATRSPRFTSNILASDCDALMDRKEIGSLAGAKLSFFEVAPFLQGKSSPLGCLAPIYDERGNGTLIKLGVVRAHEALPFWQTELEDVEGSTTLSADEQLVVAESLAAIRGGELDDRQSCEIFSELTETMWRQQPGATYAVTVPSQPGYVALDARACTEGVFVHVVLVDPKFDKSPRLRDHIRDAVASYSPAALTTFAGP